MTDSSTNSTPNRSSKGWLRRWWVAGFCLLISAVASIPYFFIANPLPGQSRWSLHMPATHDMHSHYNQMRSFYEGLSSGEIYPRWEADTNRGFGAPTTSYYPPGVYYVTALGYWVSGDWTRALLVAQWLMALGAGFALYVYARRVMGRGAALVAVAAYVLGPYRLLDQYQRGAIAELLGFVWMPLMLIAGERLMEKRSGEGEESRTVGMTGRLRWMLLLAASYGLFVWSHPPTAYQFTLGFTVTMMVLALMRREWRGLLWISGGLALGMALAAAYILPAVVEQSLVNSDNVTQDYPYHDSYVLTRLGINAGRANYFLDSIDRLWIVNAVLMAAAVVALLVLKPQAMRRKSRLKEQVIAWLVFGVFALFMMTRLSYPLGKYLPKIEIGVFTWRMLGMATLVVALLAGACAEVVKRMLKSRRRYEAGLAFAVVLWVIVGGAWFSVEEVVKPYSNGPPFTPDPEPFNYALLPRTAYGDIFSLPRVEPAELEHGDGRVAVEQWKPEHRVVRVALDDADRLLLRAFAFPGWTVHVDGQPANIESSRSLRVRVADGDEAVVRKLESHDWSPAVDGEPAQVIEEVALGDIAVPLEPGVHEVRLDYRATPVRRAGNALTLASLGFIVAGFALTTAWQWRGQRKRG